MKQVVTSRKGRKAIGTKKDSSKGGSVTKAQTIQRQVHVEKFMKMGYSLTAIASIKIDGNKLAAIDTISKDMDIIRSRWLDMDPEWFHRARLARIEAKDRLIEQLVRLNELLIKLLAGKFDKKEITIANGTTTISVKDELPRKLTYTEAQLTAVISKIYEIDADFDPEQYVDSKIQESIKDKIKEATPTTS